MWKITIETPNSDHGWPRNQEDVYTSQTFTTDKDDSILAFLMKMLDTSIKKPEITEKITITITKKYTVSRLTAYLHQIEKNHCDQTIIRLEREHR